ncbi:TetR/AcrR family transcriptional regulator [Rhodococcus qingshengii]|uniref:TetR/AcrR family transcriptional regulator n=1 Tax=Rhodococcus qingshengii TaxID=334542 RepID=UPI001C230F96|nr:TetR family transcriptional regulator [Rhodococcus qingshengii]QXC46273.1 TetR family transcriptional regulator [Rhodococcus qingshengii]
MSRLAVAERRDLLLTAAARVIARDGMVDLTTRAIAAEAGMSQGAFHYCFRSKDELLADLITSTAAHLIDVSVASIEILDSFEETLGAALRGLWETIVDPPEKQLALYELTVYALRNPGLRDLPAKQYVGYFSAAERFLEVIADRTGVEWSISTTVLARLLVAVVDGLGLNWLADRDRDAAYAVLDAFTQQLVAVALPAGVV